jgi:hypothetical protein
MRRLTASWSWRCSSSSKIFTRSSSFK